VNDDKAGSVAAWVTGRQLAAFRTVRTAKAWNDVQSAAGSQEVSYLYGSVEDGPMAWDRITPALLYFAARRGKGFGNLIVAPLHVLFQNTSHTHIHKQCQDLLF
jgi:hypothetical protein